MPHSETNPGDLPDSCGFLSQVGRSEESTEWHSPAPAGYQRGRTTLAEEPESAEDGEN